MSSPDRSRREDTAALQLILMRTRQHLLDLLAVVDSLGEDLREYYARAPAGDATTNPRDDADEAAPPSWRD